jgi:hypothetical protein
MAKTDLSIKIGAEYVGKVAFAKAEKSVKRLGKQVAALALGGGILNFGKSSVQAFYQSEKSAKALYGTLDNLNLAYRKDDVNKYIDKLSLATGVVDETLNPAFQQFLLTTRDVTKSQNLLSTALDISAGTGYDLQSVTKALSNAYSGNKTALGKMQLGLTKAQLEANSFIDIQKALNTLFAGQAASAASGYTGQIDKLNIAIDQLKENIGKGLVEGLSDGNGNIDQTAQNIAKLGTALGTATGYLAKFASGWTELFTKDAWRQFWDDLTGKKPLVQVGRGGDQGGKERAAQQKLDQKANRLAADQLKATKALTAEQKKQATLKKAGTMFDQEQISIIAALQNKLTEDEKLRLQLQFALIVGNAKEADRLSNQLAYSQIQTTGLANAIASLPPALNPFADYPKWIQDAINEINKLKAAQSSAAVTNPSTGSTTVAPTVSAPTSSTGINTTPLPKPVAIANPQTSLAGYATYRAGERSTKVEVNVAGNVVSNKDLADTIRMQLLDSSASGSFTMSNRATRGD